MKSDRRTSGTLDDATVARLWTGIGARRRSLSRQRDGMALLSGAAFAGLLALVLFRGPPTPSNDARRHEVIAVVSSAGPIRLASGTPLRPLSAHDETQRLALDDGSQVELAPGARLEIRANTATAFTVHLEGSATFDVKPGGPRRWSIVSDLATVDVIGTRFQVLDEAAGTGDRGERVVVEHGIVVVRGDNVPDHFQRLVDGQSLKVSAPSKPRASSDTVSAAISPSSQAQSTRTRSWQELARGGDYDTAYKQLGRDGLASEGARASVDDLLMLADVARLSGHGADAVAPLSNVVNEHSSDARAPVAAFTLGKLELDTLGHPPLAASAFAHAIALGLPGGLVEDAYARLVEADVKAGNVAAARDVANDYARKYPAGTRSPTMDRWVSGASSPPASP